MTDGAGPRGVRRVPASSAPELLLAILGEYVAAGPGGVWQEALVSALELLGHTGAAARQAIARAVRDGALQTRRQGRRSWLELSPAAGGALRSAAAHVEAELDLDAGRWDVFVIRPRRDDGRVRHRHRTKLLLSGLGHLGNGVWISPARLDRTMVERLLADEPGALLVLLRAEITFPDAREVVESAWDLDQVRDRYLSLVADFDGRRPVGDADCFVAWTELQQRWFACVRADPGLPPGTLPADWPRGAAHRLVEHAGRGWRPRAHVWFDQVGAHLPPAPAS